MTQEKLFWLILVKQYKNKMLIYFITKMSKYSCEKCGKSFSQKSHFDKHINRKNPCEIQIDKIKALIDKAVEEKLIELNKKLITNNIESNITINNGYFKNE